MTVTEVAEALEIRPGAVRDAIARGAMTAIRRGGGDRRAGHLLVMKDEVERYRAENLGKRGNYDHKTAKRKPKERAE